MKTSSAMDAKQTPAQNVDIQWCISMVQPFLSLEYFKNHKIHSVCILCILELIFVVVIHCADVLLPQTSHHSIVSMCVCASVGYTYVCLYCVYYVITIIIIDGLMLILRNMCCYLSVSRLSVFATTFIRAMCVCASQDMKYINFYSFRHLSLSLSLSELDPVSFTHDISRCWYDTLFHCIHVQVCVSPSFFIFGSTVLLFCVHCSYALDCTTMHNSIQPKLNILA